MAPTKAEKRVFRRGSNVLEYWLECADGFGIRSRLGVRFHVARAIVDDEGRAERLVIRSRILRRRRVLPVGAVRAVDPFARVFELDRRYRYRLSHAFWRLAVGAVTVTGPGLTWLALRARDAAVIEGRGARVLFRGGLGAAAWLRPRVRSLAAATWKGGVVLARRSAGAAVRFAAWLRPQLAALARLAGRQARVAGVWLRPRLVEVAATVAFGCRMLAERTAEGLRRLGTRATHP